MSLPPAVLRWRLAAAACLTFAASEAWAQVTVTVDANASRRPISPLVYGVHFADSDTLLDLNATVNRYGGNSTGRYNWQQNVDNRGVDYFFESIPYASSAPGELGDTFISDTKAGGAAPFLTMPMVGWVARTNASRDVLWSFSASKYGGTAFTGVDIFSPRPDAANGCEAGAHVQPCSSGHPFTGNDPSDASVAQGAAFQQGWMQHVRDTWGPAHAGGLRYWGLDNEPSIWHAAYWDVHPLGATMDEMRTKMIDYGSRIKTVDPGAQVLGPEEWGWDGYFYSGRDQQLWAAGSCNGLDCPDRVAHGGQDYVPYLLSAMRQHEVDTGQRVLDMLTLHVYPQGGEFGNDVSMAMQLKRNRSTRSLWDVGYVDESWINTQVKLIPRMRQWVASSYPGLPLGLTEYDWGAEGHISGGLAEADLLGIFGREGLKMAIRWVVPETDTPVYNAFKMYRNYDGLKSTFGEISVSATGPDPDHVAAFAAQRAATGALTVMVINKDFTGTPLSVNLANFTATGAAKVWQLTAANVITPLADVPVAANALSTTVPPRSITLFVIPGAGQPIEIMTDLAVTKTDGITAVAPGQSLTYTIVASSAGPGATSALVTDVVPLSLLCNWTCAGSGGGACAASGAGDINDVVSLPAGAYVTYTVSCTVALGALVSFTNTVQVTPQSGMVPVTDLDPGNNSAHDKDLVVASETSPVYRLLHLSLGAYLYTIYPVERDSAPSYGYVYEGVCCNWFGGPGSDGRTALFRLFSPTAGEYFYTIYPSERDGAVQQYGYGYEGIAGYCHPGATAAAPRPWYRLRYGNKHFYTIYASERDSAVTTYGYTYEGISCYLPP